MKEREGGERDRESLKERDREGREGQREFERERE